MVDPPNKQELANFTHQELFELSSINTLKILIDGKNIVSYVNGTKVEERELAFEPDTYEIGASSGTYRMTVIEPALPPPPPGN